MGSIGNITTTIMRGRPAALKTRVNTWQVPGIDGYGAQLLGEGNSEFDLITEIWCAASGMTSADTIAEQTITNCELMEGQAGVTIITDWGTDFENVLVVAVDTSEAKKPMIWNGAKAVLVTIRWKLLTAN